MISNKYKYHFSPNMKFTPQISPNMKFTPQIIKLADYWLEQIKSGKWNIVLKHFLSDGKHYITKNGLLLSEKIKQDIGIEVFPVIIRTHAGGVQKSIGAWSWFMLDDKGFDYGSCERVGLMLNKIIKLEGGLWRTGQEIYMTAESVQKYIEKKGCA